jgi:hypothetical protein
MLKPWQALEAIPGTSAVAADWQPLTGEFFPAFKSAFLQADRESAAVFPCRRECGCRHRVVTHASGRMVAVCDCDPWNCEDIPLTPDDVVVWQLNRQKLGRAIARAFGCDAKDADLRVPGTRQVAAFGSAGLPVVLTISTMKPVSAVWSRNWRRHYGNASFCSRRRIVMPMPIPRRCSRAHGPGSLIWRRIWC